MGITYFHIILRKNTNFDQNSRVKKSVLEIFKMSFFEIPKILFENGCKKKWFKA